MTRKKQQMLRTAINGDSGSLDGNGNPQSVDLNIDRSPYVYQKSKLKNHLKIASHLKLTPKQIDFLQLATSKETKMVFVTGPAGTSKTYISILASLNLLNDKKVSDLIYVRSVVESSDVKMGFLPGEKDEKLSPYIQPLMDKMEELLPVTDKQQLLNEGRVQGVPVGYLRGLNWNAKAIIADEVQNLTKKEIYTLITRVGEFSKLFILGDPSQSDIGTKSGFKEMYDLFNDAESREHGIFTYEFTEDDIVRSELVKFITKKVTIKK